MYKVGQSVKEILAEVGNVKIDHTDKTLDDIEYDSDIVDEDNIHVEINDY